VTSSPTIRIGVDIGGTFTDVALEIGERRLTAKILTTTRAPEDGVLAALRSVVAEAGIEPGEVGLIIHGTTLATNALIERKGADRGAGPKAPPRMPRDPPREPGFGSTISISPPPPLVPPAPPSERIAGERCCRSTKEHRPAIEVLAGNRSRR
jgi:N-methylhydantoinase A